MARMKIRKLHMRGFRQFRDTTLDFTHPETGEALDRICLIGPNGTGKTTVLWLLNDFLQRIRDFNNFSERNVHPDGNLALEIVHDGVPLLFVRGPNGSAVFETGVNASLDVDRLFSCSSPIEFHQLHTDHALISSRLIYEPGERDALGATVALENNAGDLLLEAPADVSRNNTLAMRHSVAQTSLDAALQFSKTLAAHHVVSVEQVSSMWNYLTFLIKKRESDRIEFENRPENLEKTKRELLREFDSLNKPVLEELAILWNTLLEPADLVLDVASASIPIQLTDSLEAFIKVKSTGEPITFGRLSSGMRDFMFRLGHIFLLYFNRTIERGFVLVDEPENSLFPDFLFELVELYESIITSNGSSTQLFMATHSPIIAAQFEPYERVVLRWQDGGVAAGRGEAPVGDDPNDILRKDFGLSNLMGPAGRRKWEEYKALKRQIRQSGDELEKERLLTEAAEIGRIYGF